MPETPDEPENHTIRLLQAIRTDITEMKSDIADMKNDIADIKTRLGNVETRLGNVENRLEAAEAREIIFGKALTDLAASVNLVIDGVKALAKGQEGLREGQAIMEAEMRTMRMRLDRIEKRVGLVEV